MASNIGFVGIYHFIKSLSEATPRAEGLLHSPDYFPTWWGLKMKESLPRLRFEDRSQNLYIEVCEEPDFPREAVELRFWHRFEQKIEKWRPQKVRVLGGFPIPTRLYRQTVKVGEYNFQLSLWEVWELSRPVDTGGWHDGGQSGFSNWTSRLHFELCPSNTELNFKASWD